MKHFIYICLFGICLCGVSACTALDRQAYDSCRSTIARSVKALPAASSLKALEEINQGVTDTLAKYGRATMSREMLDSIRISLEDYQTRWRDAYEKAARRDSIHMNRIIDMPGIGPVEFKAPPEV